jgi:hypothetical protein
VALKIRRRESLKRAPLGSSGVTGLDGLRRDEFGLSVLGALYLLPLSGAIAIAFLLAAVERRSLALLLWNGPLAVAAKSEFHFWSLRGVVTASRSL